MFPSDPCPFAKTFRDVRRYCIVFLGGRSSLSGCPGQERFQQDEQLGCKAFGRDSQIDAEDCGTSVDFEFGVRELHVGLEHLGVFQVTACKRCFGFPSRPHAWLR